MLPKFLHRFKFGAFVSFASTKLALIIHALNFIIFFLLFKFHYKKCSNSCISRKKLNAYKFKAMINTLKKKHYNYLSCMNKLSNLPALTGTNILI